MATAAGGTHPTGMHSCRHCGRQRSSPVMESTLALKPRADVTRSPKKEVSAAPQKGLMSSKKIFKRASCRTFLTCLSRRITARMTIATRTKQTMTMIVIVVVTVLSEKLSCLKNQDIVVYLLKILS